MSTRDPSFQLSVRPGPAGRALAACGVVVMLLSVGSVLAGELLGMQWLDRFDGDVEGSVPNWFHTLLLASAAALWAIHAWRERAARRPAGAWWLLAAVFAGASLDEVLAVHEELSEPLSDALDTSGLLHYAWVIPAALVVVVLAALVARSVLALPDGIRWLIVLAGALYVAGAMGIELPSAVLAEDSGEGTLGYRLVTQVEEAFETAGVVLLVATLLRLLARDEDAPVFLRDVSEPAGAGPPVLPPSRSGV